MIKHCFNLVLLSYLVSLVSLAGEGDRIFPISDVEGMRQHFDTLFERGILSPGDHRSPPRRIREGTHLVFLGDLMRRGPFGIQSVEWALSLNQAQPERVDIILGNHDINPLSLICLLPSLELGKIPDYENWRTAQSLSHSLDTAIQWWEERYALKDKVRSFWIEAAARSLGLSPSDPEFQARVSAVGGSSESIDSARLEKVLPRSEMSKALLRLLEPGGLNWKLLREGRLLHLLKTESGHQALFLHSGQPTMGNLGVTPAVPARYYDVFPSDQWVSHWETGLDHYKSEQLDTIEAHWRRIYHEPTSTAEREKAADELLRVRLRIYGDAGWDPITRRLETDANSTVYPEKFVSRYSSVPGLPEQEVIDRLAEAKVDFVFGGHIPIGDGSVFRVGYSHKYKRVVKFLLLDTSYSPVEGKQIVDLGQDGSLRVRALLRSGTTLAIDYPAEADSAGMGVRCRCYPQRKGRKNSSSGNGRSRLHDFGLCAQAGNG